MNEVVSNSIDISKLGIKEYVDGSKKHILDSPDKIIRWIKYQFEEQELAYKIQDENNPLPFSHFFDLSDCIINTEYNCGKPALTNLCDILNEKYKDELPNCFIINGYGSENRIYHEVLIRIECKNSLIHSAFFHQTKFHEDVNFEGTEFNGHASFGSCIFEKHADFTKTNFTGNFEFERSTFYGVVLFNYAKFDLYQVHFEYSVFNAEFQATGIKFINDDQRKDKPNNKPYISFYGAQFHQELILSHIEFTRDCNFEGAKFYGGVNFTKSHFTAVTFHSAEITGHILFTAYSDENDQLETVRIQNISFNHSNISGRIDLEQCKIDKFEGTFATLKNGALLRISESSIKKLDLSAIHNNGVIIFEDNFTKIKEIILKGAIIDGVVEVENTDIKGIKDRKTARILKDSALKSGNNIDALEFRKKEMLLFKEEINIPKSRSTKILLWLNGISNSHGIDWPKGLRFTIYSWSGFYLFFLITSRIEDIYSWFCGQSVTWSYSKDISNGVSYLWSLNFLGTLSEWIEKTDPSTVWWAIALKCFHLLFVSTIYIVGKIAIGYGIYQTISAFRKYGK